jgi:hypothetical protein
MCIDIFGKFRVLFEKKIIYVMKQETFLFEVQIYLWNDNLNFVYKE